MQQKYDIDDYLESLNVDLSTLQHLAQQFLTEQKIAPELQFALDIISSPALIAGWENKNEMMKIMNAINYLAALNKQGNESMLIDAGNIRRIMAESILYQNLSKCGLSKYYLEIANFETSASSEKYSDRIVHALAKLNDPHTTEEQIKIAAGDLVIRIVRPIENVVNTDLIKIVENYLSNAVKGGYSDNLRDLLKDYSDKHMTTENFLRGVLDVLVKKYKETNSLDHERNLLKEILTTAPDISRIMQEVSVHDLKKSRGVVIKSAFEPSGMIQRLLEKREKLIKAIDDALSRRSLREEEVKGGWVERGKHQPED